MEVVGLVVGIVPLASLCLEILERARDFKEYKASSLQLNARFELAKTRLKNWIRTVGIVDGNLIDPHHPLLDEPEVKRAVGMVLSCLLKNFGGAVEDAEVSVAQRHRQAEDVPSGWRPLQRSNTNKNLDQSGSIHQHKKALFWATGQKAQFTEQVEIFEILVEKLHEVVPLDNTETALKSATQALERVKVTQEEMLALVKRMQQDAFSQKIKTVQEWLDAPAIDQDFEKHVCERLEGTCDWLLQNKTYVAWESDDFLKGSAKLFWLCAPPGHGKTILAAATTERMSEVKKSPVAYFFSSPHVQAGSPVHSILRSWILQLVRADDLVFDMVYRRAKASPSQKTTKAEVRKLFQEVLDAIDGCTLVLDGYDEFAREGEARRDFLRELKKDLAWTKARVFITSRPEDDIAAELSTPNAVPGVITSEHWIVSTDLKADIALYSRNTIAQQLPKKDQQFQQELADRMTSKCDGMFLWIKLQKLELRDGKSKRSLRETVEKMPDGLTQSYVRTWNDIMARSDYDRQRGVEILRWACFATRPLTVEELTEALVHEHGSDSSCRDDMPDEIDDEYIEGEIKGLCGSLVEVRKGASDENTDKPADRSVHLVHTSAKEFLVAHLPAPLPLLIKTPEASDHAAHHMHLAEVCLRYISCDDSWEAVDPEAEDSQSVFGRRFMKYAALKWWGHWTEAKMMSEEYKRLTLHFFGPDGRHFSKWSRNDWFYQAAWTERKDEDGLNARLYQAVVYSLLHVVDHLHACNKLDFSPTTFTFGTALSVAVWREEPFFEKLLSWGAEINVACGRDGSALGSAVMSGKHDRARILLDRGADIKARSWQGHTLLAQAGWRNDLEMMKLLMDYKIDPSDREPDSAPPISWCVAKKSPEAVKLLLDHEADVTVLDPWGWSLLHLACTYDNVDVVNLLLDKGLDPLLKDDAGHTSLHLAAGAGFPKNSKALLERKPDLLSLCGECDHFMRPIHCAAQSGSVETLKILIEHGADIRQESNDGFTSLHFACRRGDPYYTHDNFHDKVEVIEFLLENGIDIMCRDLSRWTPLHAASYYGLPNATKLLIARGADILAQLDEYNHYRLPIHCAAQSKSVGTLQALLDHGADMNAATLQYWRTPLHYACYSASQETITLLVDRGGDLSAPDRYGYTALHFACESGNLDTVNFVLERGGDPSAKTCKGWTPLHSAFDGGNVQIVDRLLERGADMNRKSDEGWTPLHAACNYGSKKVVTLLIERGANVHETNNFGSTSLQIACWNETADAVEIVKLLLEKGVDLQQRASDGSTALHYACQSNGKKSSELVTFLLERGLDPSRPSDEGVTPLQRAASSGNLDTIRLLLDRGVSLSGQAGPIANSWHLMHFAVKSEKADVVKFLIEKNVPIHPTARLEQTPLNMAIFDGSEAIMERLIDAGADVVGPLWQGATLLEWIESWWSKHEKLPQWRSKAKFQVSAEDRAIRLRQQVCDIAQDALLVDQYTNRDHWPLFKHLAAALWRLGNVPDFIYASQQTVGEKDPGGQLIHAYKKCSNCAQDPILGERWVCFTCPVLGPDGGVNLCGPCRARLPEVDTAAVRDCAKHELVLVPVYEGSESIEYNDERAKDPEVKKWLETMAARYKVEGEIPPLQPIE